MSYASSGGDLHQRLLATPMDLHWAGWETNTYKLQQAGWELSAEQDVCTNTMMLALRHRQIGMEGLTARVDMDYRQAFYDQGRNPRITLPVRLMGKEVILHATEPLSWSLRPIDAQPQMSELRRLTLQSLAHFPEVPLARTQCLVLPEATVDDLLAGILERQASAKTAYFRDMVAQEGSSLPAHRFHAQIISLKNAA